MTNIDAHSQVRFNAPRHPRRRQTETVLLLPEILYKNDDIDISGKLIVAGEPLQGLNSQSYVDVGHLPRRDRRSALLYREVEFPNEGAVRAFLRDSLRFGHGDGRDMVILMFDPLPFKKARRLGVIWAQTIPHIDRLLHTRTVHIAGKTAKVIDVDQEPPAGISAWLGAGIAVAGLLSACVAVSGLVFDGWHAAVGMGVLLISTGVGLGGTLLHYAARPHSRPSPFIDAFRHYQLAKE